MERRRKPTQQKKRGSKVTVRWLDPSDPRSLEHPSHRQQWDFLIGAIARWAATEAFNREWERILAERKAELAKAESVAKIKKTKSTRRRAAVSAKRLSDAQTNDWDH